MITYILLSLTNKIFKTNTLENLHDRCRTNGLAIYYTLLYTFHKYGAVMFVDANERRINMKRRGQIILGFAIAVLLIVAIIKFFIKTKLIFNLINDENLYQITIVLAIVLASTIIYLIIRSVLGFSAKRIKKVKARMNK